MLGDRPTLAVYHHKDSVASQMIAFIVTLSVLREERGPTLSLTQLQQ